MTYNVEAQIGGKLAQLGQRLVNGAAKKIADEFFKNFAAAVQPAAPDPAGLGVAQARRAPDSAKKSALEG